MSSAGSSFGTQSPPLDAVPGQEEPLGVSSIRGDKPRGVSDKEQRSEYFKHQSEGAGATEAETQPQKSKKTKQD